MGDVASDVRFAWRALGSKPVFTAVAVLSLSLGIGANTAIFSVVESALLRGLPFRDSDRLVYLRDHQPCCQQASLSPGEFLDYQKQTQMLSGLAAYTGQLLTLTRWTEPQKLSGLAVTTNYFEVLGAKAEIGRLISSAIDKPSSETRAAVLSDATWRSIFASDPAIIGRDITLNGTSFRVVGVLPAKQNLSRETQMWISPRVLVPEYVEGQTVSMDIVQQYGSHWLTGVGRMKPGVTAQQARAELRAIAARIGAQHPGQRDHFAVLSTLQDSLVRRVRPALWVLLAAVILLLLIACANLAGLLLARAMGRTRELAVRISLGATRTEIVRLLLAESLLLAAGGGIIGIALARGALKAIAAYSPYDLPAALTPELNLLVLGFCVGVTILAALITGAVPAWRAGQIDVNEGLKEGSKGTASSGTMRTRQGLVAAEIALSVMLLTGASLLIHSFSKLISVHPGFDSANVLTARLSLPDTRYPQDDAKTRFWEKLLARTAALPGVESTGLLTDLPFDGNDSGSYIEIEGRPRNPNEPGLYANLFGASPQTFRTLRIPLINGRVFNERDDAKAPRVAVVNKDFADKAFPKEDPIGKRFRAGGDDWIKILGVVGNIRHSSLDEGAMPDMYFNYPQFDVNHTGIILRTKSRSSYIAGELRSLVRQLDPDLPVADVKTLEDYMGESLTARRFLLGLLTAFSGLAFLLAGIGLYGVLAYSVERRTQEVGVRMALGATAFDVLWVVLRESAAIAAIGVAAGLTGAMWSSSFLKSLLFGIGKTDVLAYGTAALLVIFLATIASLIPAMRALRVDPVSALRYE